MGKVFHNYQQTAKKEELIVKLQVQNFQHQQVGITRLDNNFNSLICQMLLGKFNLRFNKNPKYQINIKILIRKR